MSLLESAWNRTYGRNRITRKCHEDRVLFYDTNNQGIFAKLKYFGYTAKTYLRERKVVFPEYKNQYLNAKHRQLILENDVISFDVFDTMLLRPVCRPTDMFYFLEHINGIPDFRNIRIKAEQYARINANKSNGEINIYDIYEVVHKWCDLDIDTGVKQEIDLETNLCFANPYVFELYQYAIENGKEIIITSDMYIPTEDLLQLLKQKRYENIAKAYVSCDEGVSKHSGLLPKKIKQQYSQKKILHIGDNKNSDCKMWKNCANDTILLSNVNDIGMKNRLYAGTTVQGSVYAGIVNAHLYNGLNKECENPYFEYGYVYGGILTLGFCQWLQEVVQKENVDKILFLARDCKIIKEVYDNEYSKEDTSYFLTSRMALLPVLCKYSFDAFVDEAFKMRLLDERMTIRQTFEDLDLESVISELSIKDADMYIDTNSWSDFKKKLYKIKNSIQNQYSEKYNLLKQYVSEQIGNNKKIAIVDLGWRGSSILYLKYMIEKEFMGTSVVGAMFGSADVSMVRMRCSDSNMYSYLFSPNDSRYLEVNGSIMLNAEERLYLEYMYTDVINSVIGYATAEDGGISVVGENKNIDGNNKMVSAMHEGIRAFVRDYKNCTVTLGVNIALGQEIAYTPMYRLLNEKKALKKIFANFKEKKSTIHGFM